MKVILPYSKIALLKESSEEVLFFDFFNDVKHFITELLRDPVADTQPSDMLKSHGISRKDLIDVLIKRNVIVRSESIDEPSDGNGKPFSQYTVSYKVPRENFKKKIRRIYQELFE